ncbi:MAG: AMP-binding protein [Nannocystales bacterium]
MLTLDRISCVGEAIRDAIVTFKTNTALIEADRHRENGRWTYRELRQEAERFGALLQSDGFGSGDRCAIVMQNQAKWVVSGLGAVWVGAVLVPIDYKLTVSEQLSLLDHCKPKVLVTEYSTWVKMMREELAVLSGTKVLVTEAPEGADLGVAHRWESETSHAFTLQYRSREDVASIVYSSGTSGTPKGCMLTHDNYLTQAQVLGRMYPIAEDERFFSILPTNHAIDFMLGFLMPLMMGASVLHQRSLRPQFIRSSLKQYEVTHLAVVPTILKNLEKRIRDRLDDLEDRPRKAVDTAIKANDFLTARKPNHKLSRWLLKPIHDELGGNLKRVFAGGTFVDRKLVEFFYELGIPVAIGYGLTEATTVISVNDLEPFRSTTVGKPVDGVEVEIRNANDEGVGEVWVRGATVMKGYLDAPELTQEAIVDGWLRTGDLGSLDVSGHLSLRGRAKNMIVTEGGKNIHPEDIESAFDALPGCEELCVFAANFIWPTGTMTDEQLVVVLRPDTDADVEAMVQELVARNRKLPDFKRVSGYIVRKDDFPATASLKVKRGVLADELRSLPRSEAIISLDA